MTNPYIWKAQGDANQYCILIDTKSHPHYGWVAAVQLNGEYTTEAQEAMMQVMVDALNKAKP